MRRLLLFSAMLGFAAVSGCRCADSTKTQYPACLADGGCEQADHLCCQNQFCTPPGDCPMDGGTGGGGGSGGGGAGGGTGGGAGGGSTNGCDPSNCGGCCASTGLACRNGVSDTACGLGGNPCQDCSSSGNHCSSSSCTGCDPTRCPTGCCFNGACQPGDAGVQCGSAGNVCRSCSGDSDHCENNACRCGSNAACAPGLACVNLQCVCTPSSCTNGCCDSNTGLCTPVDRGHCAPLGGACTDCGTRGNSCGADGGCSCGAGPGCSATQICNGNVCQCDPASCQTGECCDTATQNCVAGNSNTQCGSQMNCQNCGAGTCSGGICSGCTGCSGCCSGSCITPPTYGQCGAGGSTCADCSMTVGNRADSCLGGICSCGSLGHPCPVGSVCNNTQCTCNASTCAGCCDAQGNCHDPPDVVFCGAAGSACVTCDPNVSNACQGGSCTCSNGNACDAGQYCDLNGCNCGTSSCSGCCQGAACIPSGQETHAVCGKAGVMCFSCPGSTDSCTVGACTCDGGPACPGNACVNGTCGGVCNPSTCDGGCCDPSSGACILAGPSGGQSDGLCGLYGGQCGRCSSSVMSFGGPAGTCVDGTCDSCDPLCLGGCCDDNNVCHFHQPDDYDCGSGGAMALCQVCPASESCKMGSCQ